MTEPYAWRGATIAAVLALGATAPCLASGRIDACSLISARQASAIFGTRLTAKAIHSSAAGPNAASMCNYAGARASSGFMLLAGHVKYTNAAQEVKSREKEALSDNPPFMPKPHFTPVKGLGEAAYLAKTSAYFQLHVLSRGVVIVVNLNSAPSQKTIARARKVAEIALDHMR